MVRLESEQKFPCPLCHRAAGRHDRVVVHEGSDVRVIVRCDACRHRWTVIVPAAQGGAAKPAG